MNYLHGMGGGGGGGEVGGAHQCVHVCSPGAGPDTLTLLLIASTARSRPVAMGGGGQRRGGEKNLK